MHQYDSTVYTRRHCQHLKIYYLLHILENNFYVLFSTFWLNNSLIVVYLSKTKVINNQLGLCYCNRILFISSVFISFSLNICKKACKKNLLQNYQKIACNLLAYKLQNISRYLHFLKIWRNAKKK